MAKRCAFRQRFGDGTLRIMAKECAQMQRFGWGWGGDCDSLWLCDALRRRAALMSRVSLK